MTEKITPQRVFDAAWQEFVVEDGRPAQSKNGTCRYLTRDGRRCAFGLCIPDGHPALKVLAPVGPVMDEYPEMFDRRFASKYEDLQGALHDQICYSGAWMRDFNTQSKRAIHYRTVAAEFGLRVPGE